MRLLLLCLLGLVALVPELAFAQGKQPAKSTAPGGPETRYFAAIDGLMDGAADVILKETRQGKNVTAAVLDVCYPVAKGAERKDRFVANLTVSGTNLTGSTQSIGDKQPVTVKLARKVTGDTFEFRGQITIGQKVNEVMSTDNSDLSEKEFLESQTRDDGIVAVPKDFTDVSPESIGVRVKLESVLDFVKSLKGEPLEVSVNSLSVSCDELRGGEQTINLTVDPERSAAVVAKAKATTGVALAGWTSGIVEMDRAIRFPAAGWREGEKVNREKLASTIAGVLSKTLAAQPSGSNWDANTGKLKMSFKRPSQILPALGLTETVEVSALVSPDKPGTTDKLMLWVSSPVTTTSDEGAGPKLNLSEDSGSADDEGAEPEDDGGAIEALIKELKGQRWDADKSVWK
jgi:hypothetical protein